MNIADKIDSRIENAISYKNRISFIKLYCD